VNAAVNPVSYERASLRVYVGRRLEQQGAGHAGETSVTVYDAGAGETLSDARPLPLYLELRSHSPTGFEWGYAGSGPAQLALAILADHFGVPELATRWGSSTKNDGYALDELERVERTIKLYQRFKWLVSCLSADAWVMTSKTIALALRALDYDRKTQAAIPRSGKRPKYAQFFPALARDMEEGAEDGRWTGGVTITAGGARPVNPIGIVRGAPAGVLMPVRHSCPMPLCQALVSGMCTEAGEFLPVRGAKGHVPGCLYGDKPLPPTRSSRRGAAGDKSTTSSTSTEIPAETVRTRYDVHLTIVVEHPVDVDPEDLVEDQLEELLDDVVREHEQDEYGFCTRVDGVVVNTHVTLYDLETVDVRLVGRDGDS
jgi:Family of unknown function (DUF6166)